MCEATGADVREVAKAIGFDRRIGSKFLDAGPGFGGSCFKKDILNLVYLSEYFGLPEVAEFWNSVVMLNNWHQNRISKLIIKKLFGTLSGKKIVILGFAFKSNTNDTRESAAIQICKNLLEEGAILSIHDPKVSHEQIAIDLNSKPYSIDPKESKNLKNNGEGYWNSISCIDNSVDGADAILILTEWLEYKKIDWKILAKKMNKPSWLFDSRSLIDPNQLEDCDINFWRIGDGVEI